MISCCPLLTAKPRDPTHCASCPHILSMTNRHPLAPAWPSLPGGRQCLADFRMPKLGQPREGTYAQMERQRPEKVSDMPKVSKAGAGTTSAVLTI